MKQYKDLIEFTLNTGNKRNTRNGTVTSIFGYQMRFDLRDGFPIVTTKKVPYNLIYWELMWFLGGRNDLKYLLDKNVNIWTDDALRYLRDKYVINITKNEFIKKIKDGGQFSDVFGSLGNIYGVQWRRWSTGKLNNTYIDQIQNVIDDIQNNPTSRRLIVNSWNVSDLNDMCLPPCHTMFQFYVDSEYLDLQLYQRSQDIFLGAPFNISSYSLLLEIIAKITNKTPRYFIHTIGDAHIYDAHLDACNELLERNCFPLPNLIFTNNTNTLDSFTTSNQILATLVNYKSHPTIKAPLIT